MDRWTFLAVVVAVVTVSHEIGFTAGAGARDSPAMSEFKRSLSAENQSLLKRYSSKSRYIESMLGRSKGVDKTDQIVPADAAVDKRSESSETECCSCNPNSEGCYHPTDVKRSRIIRCCVPGPSAQKREENQIDVNEALSHESPADQELLQKHQSKLANFVNAANEPAGEETNSKRRTADDTNRPAADELTEDQKEALQSLADQLNQLKNVVSNLKEQSDKAADDKRAPAAGSSVDITKRFMDDVALAKKYGVKLDDLIGAIKRRTASTAEKRGSH